jgi:hypothetical protein
MKDKAQQFGRFYIQMLAYVHAFVIACSLLLHICIISGLINDANVLALVVFYVLVIAGMLTLPYIRDSFQWRAQIRQCPKWMLRVTTGLTIYSAGVFIVLVVFSGVPLSNNSGLAMSSIPIPLAAVGVCILDSVARRKYLSPEEIGRRTVMSLCTAGAICAFFLGYKMGLLPIHPGALRGGV